MIIEELISKESILRKNAPSYIKTTIDHIIQTICYDMDINLKCIATDYVFPRVFKINEEYNIIWDQTYWQIYYDFLIALDEFNCNSDKNNSMCYDIKIKCVFSNYLALIIKNPEIAANFADFYYSNQLDTQINTIKTSIEDYLEIAKLFTAIHEQYHIIFKRDKIRMHKELYTIEKSLKVFFTLIENLNDDFIKDNYFMSKNDMLQLVSSTYKNIDLQIDILCDTYALNTCLAVFRKCWESKFSDIKIITLCLEGIRILEYFNSTLLSLRLFWQECNCDSGSVTSFQKANTLRVYLSEFVGILQLNSQEISEYENKNFWKFGNLNNNYNLEILIHSYFLSDDATKKWIKKKTINKSKFELLDWRI